MVLLLAATLPGHQHLLYAVLELLLQPMLLGPLGELLLEVLLMGWLLLGLLLSAVSLTVSLGSVWHGDGLPGRPEQQGM
jgi:hypothetical protein